MGDNIAEKVIYLYQEGRQNKIFYLVSKTG
jgi:hypothetical protein